MLRDLDGKVLDDFYVYLMTRTEPKPLSAASVRRLHAVIAAATQAGGQVGRDQGPGPSAGGHGALGATAPKEAPTVAEVQALIETAEQDDPDMAAFIALAAVTGARRGELCGLRWGDVDEGLGTLTIERS